MRIDVKVQLPQPLTRVYVSQNNKPGKSTFLLPDGKWFLVDDQNDVTHWQAFPEVQTDLRELPITCAC